MSLPLESLTGHLADVTGWVVWVPLHNCVPWEVNLTWGPTELPVYDAPAVMAELGGVDRVNICFHINPENPGNEVWPGSGPFLLLS